MTNEAQTNAASMAAELVRTLETAAQRARHDLDDLNSLTAFELEMTVRDAYRQARQVSEAHRTMRSETRQVPLTDDQIVCLAQVVAGLLAPLAEQHTKQTWDDANVLMGAYHATRDMLQHVQGGYLADSARGLDGFPVDDLRAFYFPPPGRHLSNDWDRLHWVDEPAPQQDTDPDAF